MSKLAMDLSKFRKIKSDKNTSTFQHEDGHTITVAHNGLSSKMKGEVQRIPVSVTETQEPQPMSKGGKVQKFADGSPDVEPGPSVDTPDNSAPTSDQAPAPQPDSQPQAQMQLPEAQPQPQPQAQAQPQAPAPQAAPPETQPQQPPAPTPPAQQFADIKNQDKQHLDNQAAAWQQDLANGHVTPETYQDLFEHKSTPGKIATLFGLLVGGAGAGLTHQQNPILGMMDKQIQNDLEAQVHSKENAQNYFRLNQQSLLNQAQIKQLGIQGQLEQAQIPALQTETKIKSYALAQQQMLQASYHDLTQKVLKMPEGPEKESAKQQLGIMYQRIGEKINNINDQAAGASAYSKMLFGGGSQGGADEEQQFQKQVTGMKMLGPEGQARAKDLEEKHLPGVGQASVPLTPDNRKEWMHLNNLQSSYNDAQKYLANSGILGAGWANANKAQGVALEKRMELEIGQLEGLGRFTPEEAKRYKDLIPDLTGTHFTNQDQAKLDSLNTEVVEHMNNFKAGLGLGGSQQPGSGMLAQTPGAASAGATPVSAGGAPQYKMYKGVKYMRGPKGEAIPVK